MPAAWIGHDATPPPASPAETPGDAAADLSPTGPAPPERAAETVKLPQSVTPGGVITRRAGQSTFEVHLDVFSGPFELLLGLIAKHRLDLTEIALAHVTDEFIAHIRAQQTADQSWDLSQTSEFLLVAATLLDLKAARLLPDLEPDGEEDLELIEARDLLFARLLQYRAFKAVASWCEHRMETCGRAAARQAGLEPDHLALVPELVINVTPERLAMLAADALTRAPPTVGLEHLYEPLVSVREQARIVASRLRHRRSVTFTELVSDADGTPVIVARFLAVLDLFRDGAVALDQPETFAELTVRWTGAETGEVDAGADFDEEQPTAPTDERQR